MMPSAELVGVLHVHTRFSDGTATPAELVSLAADMGLDFLGINDHRNLKAREAGWAGPQSGVVVLAGSELNDPTRANHILVYGADSIPPVTDSAGQLSTVASRGGLAIVAHPCETGARLPKMGPYPWNRGPLPGVDGVEVWNYMSDWKTGATLRDLRRRVADPDAFVGGPHPGAVDLWLQTGGCAVGGVDAHGLRFGLGPLRLEVFPYDSLLGKLHTHVLMDPERAAEPGEDDIVQALRRGDVFTSRPALGSARGFRFRREEDNLLLEVPAEASVRVRTARNVIQRPVEAGRNELRLAAGERAFVELMREGRTWICCGLE